MIKNVQLWIYCFLWPAGYTRPILILQVLYYYYFMNNMHVKCPNKEKITDTTLSPVSKFANLFATTKVCQRIRLD
jgi:hypothetical protein